MLTYADVKAFVLAAAVDTIYEGVVIEPGPNTDVARQKKSPQRMLFLTVGGGAGLTTENLFDRPFIIARAIGNQRDYNDAEAFALWLDGVFLSIAGNATIGSTRALYITRTGARPSLVEHDTGDRYHFQCTYITESQTGL